jgi:hypothetical protein
LPFASDSDQLRSASTNLVRASVVDVAAMIVTVALVAGDAPAVAVTG